MADSRDARSTLVAFMLPSTLTVKGEEGKFYVWTYDEMKEVAGEHTALIAAYYDIQEKGNWESTNIPRMLRSPRMILPHNLDWNL